jgi:hypothetical protein
VHHGLFITGQVVPKIITASKERFTNAGYVTVTEDAKTPGEESLFLSVSLYRLHGEKSNKGLGYGDLHF